MQKNQISVLLAGAGGYGVRYVQALLNKETDRILASPTIEYDPTKHNSLANRANGMCGQVQALLIRYLQTGEEKYRSCILDSIRQMDEWDHWSWFEWRANAEPDKDAPFVSFDLAYAANSYAVALAYDVLYHTLTPDKLSKHMVML